MLVNMSFGLISARKPPSSTVLLSSFVLFQKELSAVVWRLKPWRPVHVTAWPPSLAQCIPGTPFTLSILLSPVQNRTPTSSRVTWPQCLWDEELHVNGCICVHLTFSLLRWQPKTPSQK